MSEQTQIQPAAPPSLSTLLLVVAVAFASACGARQSAPEAGQPLAGAARQTPVILNVGAEREAAARAGWEALLRAQGIPQNASGQALQLNPVTQTIAGLPALPTPLRLPRIGTPDANDAAREANERESLRSFIGNNAVLLGVSTDTTTLLGITSLPDSRRRALYEQRPFLYPLRGGYGRITIEYTADGRVLNLASTALPETQAVDQALRNLRATLTAEQAVERLRGATISVRDDSSGTISQRLLPSDAQSLRSIITPAEIVVYPTSSTDGTGTARLELHLAWELSVKDTAGDYAVHVDAISGEILDASRARASGVASRNVSKRIRRRVWSVVR